MLESQEDQGKMKWNEPDIKGRGAEQQFVLSPELKRFTHYCFLYLSWLKNPLPTTTTPTPHPSSPTATPKIITTWQPTSSLPMRRRLRALLAAVLVAERSSSAADFSICCCWLSLGLEAQPCKQRTDPCHHASHNVPITHVCVCVSVCVCVCVRESEC